jgi:hypothetical protein
MLVQLLQQKELQAGLLDNLAKLRRATLALRPNSPLKNYASATGL